MGRVSSILVGQLFSRLHELDELCEAEEGEVTPEIEALEKSIKEDRKSALESFGDYVIWAEKMADTAREESDRRMVIAGKFQKKADWARGNIRALLGDDRKLEAGGRTVSVRADSHRLVGPERLTRDQIDALQKVEDTFVVSKTIEADQWFAPNKDEIKKWLRTQGENPFPFLGLEAKPGKVVVK